MKLGWRETLTLNLGWIALAIVIFGGWHPVRVALGCYLFGALQVAAVQLQGVEFLNTNFPGLSQVLPIAPFPLMPRANAASGRSPMPWRVRPGRVR